MKILHVIESGGMYGAERILLDLAASQQRLGHEPLVLSIGRTGESEKPLEVAAEELDVPVKAWRMRKGFNVGGMRKIVAWANGKGIDIFQSHGYRFDILFAMVDPFSKLRRVSTIHGYTKAVGLRRFVQKFSVLCLRLMRRVVFVSGETQNVVGQHLRNGVVIENGIDTRPFEQLRENVPEKSTPRINVLAAGRLAVEKNFPLLFDALAVLNDQKVPCQLTLCGAGSLESQLRSYAKKLKLENVEFAGYCSDVPQRMNGSDVLVFSSTTEGMPVTILEAMMLGVPVVSTAVGGIPGMLAEYSLGHVVESSPRALADAICESTSTDRFVRAGDEELAQVFSRHSADTMAARYQRLYESIMKE